MQGGPWTAEDHAAHPSFDAGLMGAIEALRPAWNDVLVFDVGGGPGRYVVSLARRGSVCIVAEPEPMEMPAGVHQWTMGASDENLARWQPGADVVLCLEVVEHIPRDQHAAAFDNLCGLVRAGGILVFSAATPGQGGQGHVAERSQDEWAGELEARGLALDLEATARLRLAADLPWHKANVMVWRRESERAIGGDHGG